MKKERDYFWAITIICISIFAIAIIAIIVLAIVGTHNDYCITVVDKYENIFLSVESVDSIDLQEQYNMLVTEPFIFENGVKNRIVPKHVSTSCFSDGCTAYTVKYKFYNTHDTTVFVIRSCRVSHHMYEQLQINKRYIIGDGSDTKLFIRHMELAIYGKEFNDSTNSDPAPILYMPSQPLWQVTH